MKLSDNVVEILWALSYEEFPALTVVRISKPLSRDLYLKVDTVLTELGGEWNRKAKGYLFQGRTALQAEALVESVAVVGAITTARDLDFSPTAQWLADEVCLRARIRGGMTVLEPSAGEGAIARAANDYSSFVYSVEVDNKRAQVLRARGWFVLTADFLTCAPPRLAWGQQLLDPFDRIVMSPPLSRKQDIDHVRHALKFLRDGGLLVSIMSAGTSSREDLKTISFRELVKERGGSIEPLPDDAFAESGTNVRTVLVTIPGGSAMSYRYVGSLDLEEVANG